MIARLKVLSCGPLSTIQDGGRLGMLKFGVSASGPMDRLGYHDAGLAAGDGENAGIEFTGPGIAIEVLEGPISIGWAGGVFAAKVDGNSVPWPGSLRLETGSVLSVSVGPQGNFGYLRFAGALDIPAILGSAATSTRARLGGLHGRALQAGDTLAVAVTQAPLGVAPEREVENGPIRVIWGVHAENFSRLVRQRFVSARFSVTSAMDRMGFRLADPEQVFADASILSLVSEPVLPGDIQILGDGTPIVLMRDHQPTGGYPRIATVIRADLDRLAQMRPGTSLAFQPVTVEHAQALWRSKRL